MKHGKYEITGPAGQRYEITVPEGTPAAEVQRVAAQYLSGNGAAPGGQPPVDKPWYEDVGEYANRAVQSAASGATFGYADEIAAGLDAPFVAGYRALQGQDFDLGKAYDDRAKVYRNEQKEFRDEYPVSAFGTEVAGGVGATLAAPWLRAATTPAQGASLAAKVGRGGLVGAGMGAAYGSGNANGDLADRLKGAATGGVIGGATGVAAPLAIAGAVAGGRGIANQVWNRLPGRQQGAAARKIVEALQRDGMTPEQAVARIEQLGPEAALLDVGPNTQALARQAATVPGRGKDIIGNFLTRRQEGTRGPDAVLRGSQTQRIQGGIDDLVPESATSAQAATEQSRRALGQNYNAAREADDVVDIMPVLDDLTEEIAQSKGGKRTALEKIRGYFLDDNGNPEISIQTLHEAKMAIDELMSGEARTSMGNVSKSAVRRYQDRLVEAIEGSGAGGAQYQAGRQGTAGQWRLSDALESGSDFMRKSANRNPEELAARLQQMSPEELHYFRIGAAQSIKDKLGDLVVRADATKKVMDIPALEDKVRQAFGDPGMFTKYIGMLQNEKQMFSSYGKIMGGSRTGEVLAEQADGKIDPGRIAQGLQQIFSTGSPLSPVRGVANIVGGVKDRITTPGPLSNRLAQNLVGKPNAMRPTGTAAIEGLNEAFDAAQLSAGQRQMLIRFLTTGGAVAGGR